MTDTPGAVTRTHGNSYNIFILVLTIMSLGIMVALLLPVTDAEREALQFFDTVVCIIFLGDFFFNLTGSNPKSAYFIKGRGWLDLIGSLPSLGFFQFGALLRLARLSRLARITRLMGGQQKGEIIKDVVRHRSQYATFITLLLVFMVLTVSSLLILQFESAAPASANANITTGGDALWWAFTTITTVGYGDRFPVTTLGRVTAVGVMMAGIGIIGALASILASMLVSPSEEDTDAAAAAEAEDDAADASIQAALAQHQEQLAATRAEIAELRQLLIASGRTPPPSDTTSG